MTQPFPGQVEEFVPVYRPPWPTKEELEAAEDKKEKKDATTKKPQ